MTAKPGKIFIALLILFLLPGCILAPAIDSFKRAGMTESDRQKLLGQRMKEFHEAISWGDADIAMGYVDPQKQEEVRPVIVSMTSDEKLVEGKIMSTAFAESAYDAHVRIKIKSYKVPFYLVKERIDEQDWKFDYSSGWLLVSYKSGA